MQSTTEAQLSPAAQAKIGPLLAADPQRLGASDNTAHIEQTWRALLPQAGQAALPGQPAGPHGVTSPFQKAARLGASPPKEVAPAPERLYGSLDGGMVPFKDG